MSVDNMSPLHLVRVPCPSNGPKVGRNQCSSHGPGCSFRCSGPRPGLSPVGPSCLVSRHHVPSTHVWIFSSLPPPSRSHGACTFSPKCPSPCTVLRPRIGQDFGTRYACGGRSTEETWRKTHTRALIGDMVSTDKTRGVQWTAAEGSGLGSDPQKSLKNRRGPNLSGGKRTKKGVRFLVQAFCAESF